MPSPTTYERKLQALLDEAPQSALAKLCHVMLDVQARLTEKGVDDAILSEAIGEAVEHLAESDADVEVITLLFKLFDSGRSIFGEDV